MRSMPEGHGLLQRGGEQVFIPGIAEERQRDSVWVARGTAARAAHASVTQPVLAEDTFLMNLYSVPEVALSGGGVQPARLRRAGERGGST